MYLIGIFMILGIIALIILFMINSLHNTPYDKGFKDALGEVPMEVGNYYTYGCIQWFAYKDGHATGVKVVQKSK